jgi:hypothetical protein
LLLLDLDLLDLLEMLDREDLLLDLEEDLRDLLDLLDLLEFESDLDILEIFGGLGSLLFIFFGLSSSESSLIRLYSISTSFSFSSSPLVSIFLTRSPNLLKEYKQPNLALNNKIFIKYVS